jgi:hypothetical protein
VSPLPRQPATRATAQPRPESLPPLLEGVTALAGAETVRDVGTAAVTSAAALSNARGSALATLHGADVEIVGSVGYDCDAMAVGARIPLDAGLPLTESVRTGRVVVRGESDGPAWVAVPVAHDNVRGGLLISLHRGADPDIAALRALAASAAAALARAAAGAAKRTSVAQVTDTLRTMPVAPPEWLRCAAVVQPATDDPSHPGGDVVVALAGDKPDVAWLLVADVCGGGLAAASAAVQVRHTAIAVLRDDLTPGGWLDAIDTALQRDPDADRFVTAAAVKLQRTADGVDVFVSTAGHPPALLSRGDEVVELGHPSLPLNLRLPGAVRRTLQAPAVRLTGDDVLLVHTDGFVDRGTHDRTDDLVELFGRAAVLKDPDAIVDALVSAMDEAVEAPRDDLAVIVVMADVRPS